ncbi:hypothetical protein ACOMHN_011877 [Nucella lapillus]
MTLTLTSLKRRLVSRRTALPLLIFLLAVGVVVVLQLSFLAYSPPALFNTNPLRRLERWHAAYAIFPSLWGRGGVRMGAGGGGGRGDGEGGGGRWFNGPNCSVVEFLAGPDPTVLEAYDPQLVCGPSAQDKDVVCSTFFSQVSRLSTFFSQVSRLSTYFSQVSRLSTFFSQMEIRDDRQCVREHDDTKVPRYVYYVIFGTFEFKFVHYVSFVAAKRFIGPTAMYLIGDVHPFGPWWQRLRKDVKGVRFVYRPRPATIGGQPVRYKQHVSDLVRLQVLLLNGGLYLDADMVMVRDPGLLLTHELTLGLVTGTGLGNAFMAVKRNNAFLRDWYRHYNVFNPVKFFNNSLWRARALWRQHPERVHMESDRLYRPDWFEADKLFKGWDYDWRQNYAVHVWTNGNPVPRSEEEVQTSNTTIAQVFRNALYGDPAPRTS